MTRQAAARAPARRRGGAGSTPARQVERSRCAALAYGLTATCLMKPPFVAISAQNRASFGSGGNLHAIDRMSGFRG